MIRSRPFSNTKPLWTIAALTFAIIGASVAASPADSTHISLQAHNEPVRSVLAKIAKLSGANITIESEIVGYVTVTLHDVDVESALKAVLLPLGDSYRREAGVYFIRAGKSVESATAMAPVVLPVSVISVHQAASQLRALFQESDIHEDTRSNSLVVLTSPADLQAIRTVLQGIDVRNPTTPTTEGVPLHLARADAAVAQLKASFPRARFSLVSPHQLLVTATPSDLVQIKTALQALEVPEVKAPATITSADAVRVTQRSPADVAKALARQIAGLRTSVSGSAVILVGPPDVVERAKTLIAQLDVPPFEAKYTQVYRIRSIDATSVGDLLKRSFSGIDVNVVQEINAVAVTATAAQQQRIADGLQQLDPAAGQGGGPGTATGASYGSTTEVVTLKSAIPGQSSGSSDIVTSITQALQTLAPDVHVVQLSTPGQIALIGPSTSIRNARDFIDKVDNVAPQVILDTEILEIDESTAKNLGVQLGTAVLSTTYTESTPAPLPNGTAARLGGVGNFGRTPLSFTAQLNLAISNGHGRVLADPRITTLSGRTASIRAGDTISILTTTSGNAGTIATTQVQSFQTGVTLDITPLVDPLGEITVSLHPVVNSLIGTNNGIPEISTRDTQTTVHLRDNETFVIGGLIQESDTRTTTKLPVISDIPLLGRVFRNESVDASRNELVIVVTPHVVKPGESGSTSSTMRITPTPQPLPTLPPNTVLPQSSSKRRTAARAPVPSATLFPTPLVIPSPHATSLAPAATPSAFLQTNVYTYGAAPQSNFARPTDPVQIFYATLSPTVVTNGTSVQLSVITTSNASNVKLQVGSQTIALGQIGPGKWQGTFPFPLTSVTTATNPIILDLIASRSDGTSSTITIPVNANGGQ